MVRLVCLFAMFFGLLIGISGWVAVIELEYNSCYCFVACFEFIYLFVDFVDLLRLDWLVVVDCLFVSC